MIRACVICVLCVLRAREELRKRVNITGWQDKAIVAVVSRLTPQKGVHLIKHAAYKVCMCKHDSHLLRCTAPCCLPHHRSCCWHLLRLHA